MFLTSTVKFWFYLVFLIPSIVCSLFVLYYLLFDRILRRALNNHVVIVLLFICLACQVTVYPWKLYYLNSYTTSYPTFTFCVIWGFIDWGFFVTQAILFAWTSIERHILIFHDRWVSTRKKRFFIHYLPPVLLIFYCFIFYSIIFFFPPCENLIASLSSPCIHVCLYDKRVIFMWETIIHQILPNLIIIICSITLILRVLWQKHRINQPIQWRKHRKMTLQLIFISLLYLIFSFPNIFVILIELCGLSGDVSPDVKTYTDFFSYFVLLFFPFVCIFSLPDLRNKIMKILPLRRRHRARSIVPGILSVRNNINNQTMIKLECTAH
jgi:hypothetical protein